MQQQQHMVSGQAQSDKLTTELEMWRFRGWQVTSREPTIAHMVKPKGSPLGWVILLLAVSLLLIPFSSPLAAGITFVVGLVLILAYQAGRRDKLVQLTVDPDGTVYQE